MLFIFLWLFLTMRDACFVFFRHRGGDSRVCTIWFGQSVFLYEQHMHVHEIQFLNDFCPSVFVSSFVSRVTGCCRRHWVSLLDWAQFQGPIKSLKEQSCKVMSISLLQELIPLRQFFLYLKACPQSHSKLKWTSF